MSICTLSDEKEKDIIMAAIEGGGTTFVVSIARFTENKIFKQVSKGNSDPSFQIKGMEILKTESVSSENPKDTVLQVCEFLRKNKPNGDGFASVGIALFGPLGVSKLSKDYGKILSSSPKKEWRNVDVLSPILKACSSEQSDGTVRVPPHKLDTDVNAPAMAEYEFSEKKNTSSLAYVTVGTGVGVGLVVNGKPVHGRMHPEGGHICVQPLANDTFSGYSWGTESSPYRGVQTVEGITSSVALTERLLELDTEQQYNRESLATLSDDHPIWDHAANSLANLCVTLILMLSIEEIVLGGGVMERTILFPKIHRRVKEIINNYVELPDNLNEFIRPGRWGKYSGLAGVFVLARKAYLEEK